jgi:hypothetical protein
MVASFWPFLLLLHTQSEKKFFFSFPYRHRWVTAAEGSVVYTEEEDPVIIAINTL